MTPGAERVRRWKRRRDAGLLLLDRIEIDSELAHALAALGGFADAAALDVGRLTEVAGRVLREAAPRLLRERRGVG